MSVRQYVHQGVLEQTIKDLFPLDDIVFNARKDSNIANPITGRYFELDVWIPRLNVSVEFQDVHHYRTHWYYHNSLDTVVKLDDSKRSEVNESGATLIRVPFWWDGSIDSLRATVYFERPDLDISNLIYSSPIPVNPPIEFFESPFIPGVGELMHASFVQDINDLGSRWWVGEKYDGIRVCWNPVLRLAFSRLGAVLNFPFQTHLPKMFLESELWFGRGNFYDARSSLADNPVWSFVRLIAFDNPDHALHHMQFEKRYAIVAFSISPNHPFLIPASRQKCKNKHHLSALRTHVINDGGEGVILRKPQSVYESGRSDSLLKLKAARGDHEALVVDVASDLTCTLQLPDGIIFEVPNQKFPENAVPKKGEIVTFEYENYSKRSVPVGPTIVRVRTDLTWRDVVRQHFQDEQAKIRENSPENLPENSPENGIGKSPENKRKPRGFWADEKHRNRRKFFEEFARKNGMDPLVPSSWYECSTKFMQERGAKNVLYPYNGSFVRAVLHLFPGIGLRESKFKILPRKFWDSVPQRRAYFDRLARQHGFDPLVSANWYSQPLSLFSSKMANSILSFYDNNVPLALENLYPEIGINKTNFKLNYSADYWADAKNRKTFFTIYAKEKRFDPLLAENWFSVTTEDILHCKFPQGAESVLAFYSTSVSHALLHLFPDIGLDASKFSAVPEKHWHFVSNRKKFFANFAQRNGFSAKNPSNWYSIVPSMIYELPGGKAVLSHYEGSVAKALTHLFPNIGVDKSKFVSETEYWGNEGHRRDFFVKYAKTRGFDPFSPNNWYPLTPAQIELAPGGNKVLQHYRGSLRKAITHLFPDIGVIKSKFIRNTTQARLG
eukprot:Phypoly_transcript_02842.p1 GENE.Phypoly_transcript_02842~~Phypoly_transcript_02842.p1  ORF type:complete len:838 (+),score=97.84 Phypoly_transcript_02842:84-2597(+)